MYYCLALLLSFSIAAMDNSDSSDSVPYHEPIPRLEGSSDIGAHIHHTYSSKTIERISENKNGEHRINIKVEELKESDGDKEEVRYRTKRMLIITNGVTAVVTALITAGGAFGIAYTKCNE